ncbi:outer membrane protein [Microbulbifer agarilyticus]|uniref:outer membrane protein n=1 Tax=Microbulbifer agarilyticus TaxID=260552 RepID=UPI001CD3A430|nr:hypothetical protein [Microbulbifer agarilyticus]MCA0892309.1 hypothetical protein [Microbulbifer agarilyticus]
MEIRLPAQQEISGECQPLGRGLALSLVLLVTIFLIPVTSLAQNAEQESEKEWEYSLTPYLFLPVATEGTSTVAGTEADLDLDLSDVLDILDIAFATRFEARRDRFGILADLYYVSLSMDQGATLKPAVNPELDLTATLNVDVDVRQGWLSLQGMYRAFESPVGAKYPWAVDLSAGARWNYLKQEIDTNLEIDILPGPGIQQSLGGTETWWEPVVGFRTGIEVSSCLTLALRADVGGFGAGGDDLQWGVLVGAERAFNDRHALRFGYLFYGIDYATYRADGRFAYDIDQHGPYLAYSWRW